MDDALLDDAGQPLAAATLYVVATPIGNLGDLSPRAARVLREADCVCAEDTRRTAPLLQMLRSKASRLAVHEHNELRSVDAVLTRLGAGERVALVTDAGTPAISDPGARLVAAIAAAGYPIVPVPGACAAIAALSVAGLPEGPFLFEGFLPQRGSARSKRLDELLAIPAHLVLYEAPQRLLDLLKALHEHAPHRPITLARELTKRFETILRGDAESLLQRCEADANQQRGEFVVVLEWASPASDDDTAAAPIDLLKTLLAEVSPAVAAKLAAKISGAPREACYRAALAIAGR